MLFLVRPSARYSDSYLEALKEFQAEGRYLFYDTRWMSRNFHRVVDELLAEADPAHVVRPGLVPATQYWLISRDDGGRETYVGRAALRHWLDRNLLHLGGHIGYAIRPTARRTGCGTAALRLVLPEARRMGFDRVLVTCDADNIGSRKIIERNGGILENAVPYVDLGRKIVKLRFWIRL